MHVETVADRIRESTLTERLIAILAGALGVAALILACAGLYGLLAYAVSRHGREIGLRIALGARPASVLWMVQRESLVLAAIGIARRPRRRARARPLRPDDAVRDHAGRSAALAAASAAMLLVASGAAYMPARRAASVDPVVALKRDS